MSTTEILRDFLYFHIYPAVFEADRVAVVAPELQGRSDVFNAAISEATGKSQLTTEDKALGWELIRVCFEILGRELTQLEDSEQLPVVYPALNASSLRSEVYLVPEVKAGQNLDSIAQLISISFVRASQLWKDVFGVDGKAKWYSSHEIEALAHRAKQMEKGILGCDEDNDEDEDSDGDEVETFENPSLHCLMDHLFSLIRTIKAADDRQAALSSIYSLGNEGAPSLLMSSFLVCSLSDALESFLEAPEDVFEARKIVRIIDCLTDPTARRDFGRLREWASQIVASHQEAAESEDENDSDDTASEDEDGDQDV